MFTFDYWHMPDGETHLPGRMKKGNLRVDGRLTYQYPLYLRGMKACRARRVAVDVGAHIGLFSYWMVRDFAQLVAFEPVARHRDCWRRNVPTRPDDILHACALGAHEGSVRMETVHADSTGGTHVAGAGDIPMRTLDSFDLPVIDLLKIDCEGYELDVLQGAADTLRRCRPVVIVEQRPRQIATFGYGATDAVKLLRRLGAAVVSTDQRDYILAFANG
jgi:FkbM family methyltransferase